LPRKFPIRYPVDSPEIMAAEQTVFQDALLVQTGPTVGIPVELNRLLEQRCCGDQPDERNCKQSDSSCRQGKGADVPVQSVARIE